MSLRLMGTHDVPVLRHIHTLRDTIPHRIVHVIHYATPFIHTSRDTIHPYRIRHSSIHHSPSYMSYVNAPHAMT